MTSTLERNESFLGIPGETPEQQAARIAAAVQTVEKSAESDTRRKVTAGEIAALVGEPMLYGGVDAMQAAHQAAVAEQAIRVEQNPSQPV